MIRAGLLEPHASENLPARRRAHRQHHRGRLEREVGTQSRRIDALPAEQVGLSCPSHPRGLAAIGGIYQRSDLLDIAFMGGFNDHGALILLAVQCAVEQAGVRGLIEGRKIAYEVVPDNRTGSPRLKNLKPT
jgi:hypothetical protein